MALSVKQEKFCIEYAKSGNARQAYKDAGYSVRNDRTADANACRLLTNANVKERLAELAEEAKNESIADITEMQQKLTSIIRQEAEEEVIVVINKGDFVQEAQTLTKKPSLKEVISAIQQLGKMQGAYDDSVRLSGNVGVVIVDDIESG